MIIAFLHMLASHSDKFQALYKVLFRHNLPNLLNLTATVLVFATVIYLQVKVFRYISIGQELLCGAAGFSS